MIVTNSSPLFVRSGGGVDMWKRHEKTLVFVSFAVAAVVLLSLIGRLFS